MGGARGAEGGGRRARGPSRSSKPPSRGSGRTARPGETLANRVTTRNRLRCERVDCHALVPSWLGRCVGRKTAAPRHSRRARSMRRAPGRVSYPGFQGDRVPGRWPGRGSIRISSPRDFWRDGEVEGGLPPPQYLRHRDEAPHFSGSACRSNDLFRLMRHAFHPIVRGEGGNVCRM